MAAIDFFGYLFLAMGPGAAFYGVFIAPKSFVVLLSIFRCAVGALVASVGESKAVRGRQRRSGHGARFADLHKQARDTARPRRARAPAPPPPPPAHRSAFFWLVVLLFTSAVFRGGRGGAQRRAQRGGGGMALPVRGSLFCCVTLQPPFKAGRAWVERRLVGRCGRQLGVWPTCWPPNHLPCPPSAGFEPISPTAQAYAGVVLAAVAIEEAARFAVWRMHE